MTVFYSIEKRCNLARSFNPVWADNLESATEGELKDAIISIVTVRHSIAHGGSGGITYRRIKDYYQNAVKVVELLEKQCNTE